MTYIEWNCKSYLFVYCKSMPFHSISYFYQLFPATLLLSQHICRRYFLISKPSTVDRHDTKFCCLSHFRFFSFSFIFALIFKQSAIDFVLFVFVDGGSHNIVLIVSHFDIICINCRQWSDTMSTVTRTFLALNGKMANVIHEDVTTM